jgi:hypothetical protein
MPDSEKPTLNPGETGNSNPLPLHPMKRKIARSEIKISLNALTICKFYHKNPCATRVAASCNNVRHLQALRRGGL